jgi:hypothetical protein
MVQTLLRDLRLLMDQKVLMVQTLLKARMVL